MATVDECRAALATLAARLDANADETSGKIDLDRPLACTVADLGVVVPRSAHRRPADRHDRRRRPEREDPADRRQRRPGRPDRRQARLREAFMSGRIGVNANPFDMLKLRKLL